MQEEVNEKTIAFCIRNTKLTAAILRRVIVKYLQMNKQRTAKKRQKKEADKRKIPEGKITVKELAKQNAGMVNIEITAKNIKEFERYGRKYGVNYALMKDKTKNPPVYLVFFKARDKGAIDSAFREFSQKQLKRANRPSIREKLAVFREVVAGQKKDKSRKKQQEQSR